MKKIGLIAVVALSFSAAASADGFVCNAVSKDLTVKVYNNTQASNGTRTGSIMIVSDPSVSSGNKTIARFKAENSRLTNGGAYYIADTDLRYNDSSRGGEYIGGTRLAYVDSLILDVDFNYGAPVAAGELVKGKFIIVKRDGSEIALAMECERYLKN